MLSVQTVADDNLLRYMQEDKEVLYYIIGEDHRHPFERHASEATKRIPPSAKLNFQAFCAERRRSMDFSALWPQRKTVIDPTLKEYNQYEDHIAFRQRLQNLGMQYMHYDSPLYFEQICKLIHDGKKFDRKLFRETPPQYRPDPLGLKNYANMLNRYGRAFVAHRHPVFAGFLKQFHIKEIAREIENNKEAFIDFMNEFYIPRVVELELQSLDMHKRVMDLTNDFRTGAAQETDMANHIYASTRGKRAVVVVGYNHIRFSGEGLHKRLYDRLAVDYPETSPHRLVRTIISTHSSARRDAINSHLGYPNITPGTMYHEQDTNYFAPLSYMLSQEKKMRRPRALKVTP